MADNPALAYARANRERFIEELKDESGRVLIPGFYDKVNPPNDAELKAWASLPFDEAEYLKNEVGSTELTGEPGYIRFFERLGEPSA